MSTPLNFVCLVTLVIDEGEVTPAQMLEVLKPPPYVPLPVDDDDHIKRCHELVAREMKFWTELADKKSARTTGYVRNSYGGLLKSFANLARAYPTLTFHIECNGTIGPYSARHWFSGGVHTHKQNQTLTWDEKVAVAAQ